MLELEYPTLWANPLANFEAMETTDGLVEATLVALETGELTPLVKKELKYTIQSRRLAKGQAELGVDFNDPKSYELREDEKEKILRRREQNKLAARRFRQRRRKKGPICMKMIQELEAESLRKMNEVKRLRKEKDELQAMFENHLMVCPYTVVQNG